jgi:hypothetical protein
MFPQKTLNTNNNNNQKPKVNFFENLNKSTLPIRSQTITDKKNNNNANNAKKKLAFLYEDEDDE